MSNLFTELTPTQWNGVIHRAGRRFEIDVTRYLDDEYGALVYELTDNKDEDEDEDWSTFVADELATTSQKLALRIEAAIRKVVHK